MATATEYTAEQLNYYRICYVATDILPEGLRSIFKQEWDNRYMITKGEWKDEPRNGKDFYNAESKRNRKRNAHLLNTMTNGNRSEWDCTMLFYTILFSDCIGSTLNPLVKLHVDDLRRFRNKEFAHMPRGQLSDGDFKNALGKVHVAFQGLGLSTVQIHEIAKQTTFPTKELSDILNKVEDLKKELQENEKQKQVLKDQLKENEEQRKSLAHQLQEKEERRQSLADQLQEREQQRKSLEDQLLQNEEHQQGLENQLKENKAQRKSLEDQLEENEDQRQILVDQLQIKDVQQQNLADQLQQREEQLQVLEDQLQNDSPSFCILPPKPSHDIAGRNNEVTEITQQLKELKQADKNTLSYLYISGNPGSGKSQLAGLVAKQLFDNAQKFPNANAFVMTLNAESLDTLLESYFSFARHLKCPEYAVTNILQSQDLKTGEKITHLKTLISTRVTSYSSWLLVVDNVKSISQVLVHLPGPGNEQWVGGQLLITTQDTASVPLPSSFISHISVKKGMKPDDACSLLANLSGIEDSDVRKVAEALDYQPLALASAATYVKQLQQSIKASRFGWNNYLEKLGEGQRSATETILADTNPNYPKSMTEATKLAVNEIVQSDKIINHTLSFLSLCSPEPLSQDIVINYILSVDEEIQDKEMIIMRIQRCSLILLQEEDGDIYIGVHQVVRDVIHPKSVHYEVVSGAITAFSRFIDDSLPENQWLDIDTVVQTKRVAPHLKCLIMKVEDLFSKENVIHIIKTGSDMLKLGQTCLHHCDFNSARKYFEYSLETFLGMNGPEDVTVATSYSHLGSICQRLGDFEQAKEFHHRALNVKLNRLGPEHVEVAACYSHLGSICQQLGDFEQAKKYHHRDLDVTLKRLGPEHVDVASSYSQLGSIYQQLGDIKQAKEFHHDALSIRLQRLGPEHVKVASSYSSLGSIYQQLGDFKQAKEFHHRALDITLNRLGPEHVDVATAYGNLGSIYEQLGDFEKAKEFYHRDLDIKLKRLGPEHVDVASSYSNLASIYQQLGDFEQAKEIYHRALNVKLNRLEPEHVEVAACYSHLGSIYQQLGDFEQAKEFHHRALNITLKRLGPEHVDVATSYSNMGSICQRLDDFQQAKEFHHRALNVKLNRLGPEHVEVAACYSHLGSIYQQLGDFQQAKEYHHRDLDITLKRLGPEHVDVASSYSQLGSVYQQLGDIEQAKEFHHCALNIRLQRLGPEHVKVASSYSSLGSIYQQLGDFEQAKEFHHRALDITLNRLGPEHVDVATAYGNLGSIYEQLGDFEKAKEFYHRDLDIKLKRLGPEHVKVAACYSRLGAIYQQLSDFEQAKEFHHRASNITSKFEPARVDVSNSQENMVTVEQASVEQPMFSESNNPLGVIEQKQHRHVTSKSCRIL